MLERASACLKSRARDSLRRAHGVARSKRALHSTFWDHGAGDLELSPWHSSNVEPIPDLLRKEEGLAERVEKVGSSVSHARTYQEGVFLDFLYPPQALAWLRRTNICHSEIREKRNARRLQEGSVRTCRGYASKSLAGLNETATHAKHPETNNEAVSYRSSVRQKQEISSKSLLEHGNENGHQRSYGQHGLDVLPTDNSLAHSAGDLPNTEVREAGKEISDIHQELIQLMRLKVKNKCIVQKAWGIYNRLDEKSREDVRLKTELLTWMSRFASKIADAHCISLYWALPLERRTLTVYSAALDAFLRRGDLDFATALQKEALRTIPNAQAITLALFGHAMSRQSWPLVSQVLTNHSADYAGLKKSRLQALICINAANMPHLVHRTAQLIRWNLKQSKHDGDVSVLLTLSLALAKEALAQFLQQTFPNLPRQAGIRDVLILFERISRSGPENLQFIEDSLVTMLQHPSADYDNDLTRRMISQVYYFYQGVSGDMPKENILMLMLRKATDHAAAVNEVREPKGTISLDEVLEKWKKFYGKLSIEAVNHLISHYAFMGKSREVDAYFDYLIHNYPNQEDHEEALPMLVYVHARRADLEAAKKAFERVTRLCRSYGITPSIRCWNNLLYTHARIDDLPGALSTFDQLLERRDPKPTAVSFQQILQILSRQGDLDGINKVLEFYDYLLAEERPLSFTSPLITALIHNEMMEKARKEVEEAISRAHSIDRNDSLTPLFNILISAYAVRRDYDASLEVYEWMRKEGVQADSLTYAAICQALVLSKRTTRAYKILRDVMPRNGVTAKAFNYAIVITGYRRENNVVAARAVRQHMLDANVKESLSSQIAGLKLRIASEDEITGPIKKDPPLEQVQRAMLEAIAMYDNGEAAPKEPLLGYQNHDIEDTLALCMTSVMQFYGRRKSFDAIKGLHEQYMSKRNEHDSQMPMPTIRVLSAFMSAHLAAGEHAEVEACWNMAMERAEKEAPLVQMPGFKIPPKQAAGETTLSNIDKSLAETGFGLMHGVKDASDGQARSKTRPVVPKTFKIAPTRRYILCGALRSYITALAKQTRHVDAVKVVTGLLKLGYALDHLTWNFFIKTLCAPSPPLALAAFTFMERFLIPQFSGWAKRSKLDRGAHGLQRLHVRYGKYQQVTPQIETMARLASALLRLRQRESTLGRGEAEDLPKELAGYVGEVRDIRTDAPRTVYAVMSMPNLGDIR